MEQLIFLVKQVPGWDPEQRESETAVLYLQIIIILISYIIIYYYYYIFKLLITENHPSQNWKRNSNFFCWSEMGLSEKVL